MMSASQESTPQPILTIAIPTYNRAGILDKQLEWAVNAIAGRWDQVELIVSDNGSPDKTPDVCQAWHQKTEGRLRVFRQPQNVGLPRNAIFCIQQARGEFIWLVSDDDEIADHTLDWLLERLYNSDNRLSLIHFNLAMRAKSGSLTHERVHPFYQDRYSDPGNPLFEECSKFADISLILSTSVYRLRILQDAIKRWPSMSQNTAFPTYLAGYAAAHGAMIVRAQPSLTYIEDTSSFISPWPLVVFYDVPEMYWHLRKEGYSANFIRPKILGRMLVFKFIARYPLYFIKSLRFYVGAFRMTVNRS